jgi:hypothetical protein
MNSIGDTWSEGKSKTGGGGVNAIPERTKTYVRKLVWFPLLILYTLFILTFDFVPSFFETLPLTLMSV